MNPDEKFAVALAEIMSPDARIRNAAAITLMDSGNPEAVDALVAAIEIAAYREARGTLIYALSGFDCTSRFSQLFRWAIEGGFEASHEALSILREQRISPDETARKECLTLLGKAQKQMDLDNDLQDELLSLLG
ncbi:HEAT repeat domain-containing protein [Massilia sp. SR12]